MTRPIDVDALIAELEGSDLARERVALLLKTFSQEQQVQEAAAKLDISPQYFHGLRQQILQAAVRAAEPKPLGRPAQPPPDPNLGRIAELEQRIRDLTVERDIGLLREEMIVAGMGHKLKGLKKNDGDRLRCPAHGGRAA